MLLDTALRWGNDDADRKAVRIELLQDGLAEATEAFRITLSNPQGGVTLGEVSTTRVTIAESRVGAPDDEGPVSSDGNVIATATDSSGVRLVAWITEQDSVRRVFCQAFDAAGEGINTKKLVSSALSKLDAEGLLVESPRQGFFVIGWSEGGTVIRQPVEVKSTGVKLPQLPAPAVGRGVVGASDSAAVNPITGEVFLAWEFGSQVRGRRLTRSGRPIGPVLRIDGPEPGVITDPAVAFDSASNRFVVAWTQHRATGDTEIIARFVSPSGTPVGEELNVSTNPLGHDTAATVASNPEGVLVVWRRDIVEPQSTRPALAAANLSASGVRPATELPLPGGVVPGPAALAALTPGHCLAVWAGESATGTVAVYATSLLGCDGRAPRRRRSWRLPGLDHCVA